MLNINTLSTMKTIYFLIFSFISVIKTHVINSSLKLSIIILLIYGSVLYYLDINKDEFFDDFQQNILVEAHGLLFDLIIIIIIFEAIKRQIFNNNKIKRLENNLSDYKILTTLGQKSIIINTLRELCDIKSVHIDVSGLDLSEAKLDDLKFSVTDFSRSNLSRATFLFTKFHYCDFSETTLYDCDFSGSTIRFSKFEKCIGIDKTIFASTHITDDCKLYLESVLSERQLDNIIWIDSKENIQDYKVIVKASVNKKSNLRNMPRKRL